MRNHESAYKMWPVKPHSKNLRLDQATRQEVQSKIAKKGGEEVALSEALACCVAH